MTGSSTWTESSADFGITMTEKVSTCGTNGRAGWVPVPQAPAMAFTPYYAAAYATAKSAATQTEIMIQVGKSVTNAVVAGATKTQIDTFPGEVDVNGNVGHNVSSRVVDAGLDGSTQLPDLTLNFF